MARQLGTQEFLFYHEKDRYTDAELSDTDTMCVSHHQLRLCSSLKRCRLDNGSSGTSPVLSNTDHIGVRYRLVKQTYSVLVEPQIGGQRKWHLSESIVLLRPHRCSNRICSVAAYFIPDTSGQLLTVDDVPELAACQPPEGMYVSAKLGKGRARDCWTNLGGDRQSDYLLDMHQGTSPPTGYPMYTGYGTPQHDVCTRARAGGTTLQPASWQESPLSPLDLRRPLPPMAVPQLGMAPLPQKPSHSRYLPRSATDDAALRSLRPF